MTKDEVIDEIRTKCYKQYITTFGELCNVCDLEGVEPFDDVLSPIEWDCCDRCGDLHDSDNFMWVQGFPFEDDNEGDQKLLKALDKVNNEYDTLCWKCVRELKGDSNER